MAVGDITYLNIDTTGGGKASAWVDPSKMLVFATDPSAGDFSIYSYSYTADGLITYITKSAASTDDCSGLFGDATNMLLFDCGYGRLRCLSYDALGTMTVKSADTGHIGGVRLMADPSYRVLLVASNRYFNAYRYSTDGVLTFVEQHYFDSNTIYGRDVWMDTINHLAFVVHTGTAHALHSYAYSSLGDISYLGSNYQSGDYNCVEGDANKRVFFVGTSNSGSSKIFVYTYDAVGNMTYTGESISQSNSVSNMWADTLSSILYVHYINGIKSYSYDASGNLTLLDTDTTLTNAGGWEAIIGDPINTLIAYAAGTGVALYSYVGRSLRAPKIMQFF